MTKVYEIRHSYTDDVEGLTAAPSAVDALAHYSLALGYADPREVSVEEGESLFYRYTLDGPHPERVNLLGMVVTNYEVHAVEVSEMTCADCGAPSEAHSSLLCESCEGDRDYERATRGGCTPYVSDGDGADGWPIRLDSWRESGRFSLEGVSA